MSVISAGIFTTAFRSQNIVSSQSEAYLFVHELTQFLNLRGGDCRRALENVTLPPPNTEAPLTLRVNNLRGLTTVQSGTIVSGTPDAARVVVRNLTLSTNNALPNQMPITVNGQNLFLSYVNVRLELEYWDEGRMVPLSPQNFVLPVYVDGGGVIRECQVALSSADLCAGVGGVYDSATNSCLPETKCYSQGAYVVVNCESSVPGYSSNTCVNK
ncbi:MAG: hypothetical protein NZ480_07475, partial [Bdellovibrionaceae bacterium]|nr:hypothetical protein [Pseudobdellovibrionaceae bacterium]